MSNKDNMIRILRESCDEIMGVFKEMVGSKRAFKQCSPNEVLLWALLFVNAKQINEITTFLKESLSHEICMGVRKGAFGIAAPDHVSLKEGIEHIAIAVESLAAGEDVFNEN